MATPIYGSVNYGTDDTVSLFKKVFASSGGIAGGASDVIRIESMIPVGGAVGGGASSEILGLLGAGGYPMYGDVCYGDMPYLLRQFESVGGAIAGGKADINITRPSMSIGGAIFGGASAYVRIWSWESVGGFIGGGWGDEDGDFSKVVYATFIFRQPEVIFVGPSERWDIPNILRSLE